MATYNVSFLVCNIERPYTDLDYDLPVLRVCSFKNCRTNDLEHIGEQLRKYKEQFGDMRVCLYDMDIISLCPVYVPSVCDDEGNIVQKLTFDYVDFEKNWKDKIQNTR